MSVHRGFVENLVCCDDDQETKQLMIRLASEMLEAGTQLVPGIRLYCEKKQFRVEIHGDSASAEPLLVIPASCFLPLTKFTLNLEADRIVLTDSAKDISALQSRLMKLQVNLFNSTEKIRQFSANSTAIILGLEHPLHLGLLASRGLTTDTTGQAHEQQADEKQLWDALLADFLQSRSFGLSNPSSGSVLVPVADFLNHDPQATTFSDRNGLALAINKVVVQSQECFLNYGKRKDTLDMFRYYHFVPGDIRHLISVPTIVPVMNRGALHIHAVGGLRDKSEPPLMKRLPRFLSLEGEVVSCENICASERSDLDTLDVGIDFMVKMLAKSVGFTVTEDLIRETKFNLLEANKICYTGLIQLANKEPITARNKELLTNIVLMSERQLTLLKGYAAKKGLI